MYGPASISFLSPIITSLSPHLKLRKSVRAFRTIYCFTPTGFINGEVFEEIMEVFAGTWGNLHPGLKCLLYCDNLPIHRNSEVLRKFQQILDMQYLPPNTSHFTQPLDDLVFAIYKSQLRRLADKLRNALRHTEETMTPTQILTAVTTEAENLAFRPDKIKKSFRNTGIFPWNPEVILDNAKLNVGRASKVLVTLFSIFILQDEEQMLEEEQWGPITIRTMATKVVAEYLEGQRKIVDQVKKSTRRVGISQEYNKASDLTAVLARADELEKEEKRKEREKAEKERLRYEDMLIQREAKLRKAEDKEERRKAKELAKRERERDCETRRCKAVVDGQRCKRVYYQNNPVNFIWCDHCWDKPVAFGVCPSHGKNGTSTRALVTDHEKQCPYAKKGRKRVRDEPPEPSSPSARKKIKKK